MIQFSKNLTKKIFNKFGYSVVPQSWTEVTEDKSLGMDSEFFPLYEETKSFTMTSIEKMHALFRAVNYLEINNIEGDIAECGVAAGGSMMLAAKTLLSKGSKARTIWLFDTYAGMPAPTDVDVSYRGDIATDKWKSTQKEDHNEWCYYSLEDVEKNLRDTEYPSDRIRLIKGKVEETIPNAAPDQIALLRLDTDWYSSTLHELENLYPRLVSGGVLIIDDYGHWEGCRKATDEYFSTIDHKPLFTRIDRLGVIAVKR